MATDQAELYIMLEGMADGDKQAFSQFYDATINRIFGVIVKVTANRQLAEEVTSDVYRQAWRTAASYDADLATPRTWLAMMARSRAIDAIDKAKPEPLPDTLRAEKTTKLDELLGLLSTTERQMVILAFYRGMSHNEIATHLGKSLGTVKTTLRHAQATLRSAARTTKTRTERGSVSVNSPGTLMADGHSG